MLTVRNVAERLGVSIALVYELAKGRIPCYRIGIGRGALRFTEKDVEEYLSSCRSEEKVLPIVTVKVRDIDKE